MVSSRSNFLRILFLGHKYALMLQVTTALLLLSTFISAGSQTTSTTDTVPTRDPNAVALLDRASAIHMGQVDFGGVAVHGDIYGMDNGSGLVGTFDANLVAGRHFIRIHRANKTVVFRHDGGKTVVLTDGFTHDYADAPDSEATSGLFLPFGSWAAYARNDIGVSLAPEAQTSMNGSGSSSRMKITLNLPPGNHSQQIHSFAVEIDSQSNRILAIEGHSPTTGHQPGRIAVRYEYADFRIVEGVVIPTSIVKLVAGHPISHLVITDISFHHQFSSSDMPTGGSQQ